MRKWPKLATLRIFLLYSAAGWIVCLAGVFVSARTAAEILRYFGGVACDGLMEVPVYDYWFRMACGAFGMIGVFFLLLAARPAKYAAVLPLVGWFMVFEGIVLAVYGATLGLPPTPWMGDVGFCLVGGIGILATMNSVTGGKERRK